MEEVIGYTIIRAALGLNIFLHGYVRWRAGRSAFANTVGQEFTGSMIPPGMVRRFALALPLLESVIGLMLILGVCTQAAILGGAVLMLVLLLGKSLKADWPVVSFQMIYVGFYAVLELLYRFNLWSLDSVFF